LLYHCLNFQSIVNFVYDKTVSKEGETMKKNYVVTIERQFGSLGRPIAKRVSEQLGIEYYDRDIVDITAAKLNLPVSTVSDYEEKAKSNFFSMLYPLGMGTTEMQDVIFQTQKKIILELADKESCIIVGRCADFMLKNYPNVMKIFIYAPYKERLRNCVERFKMQPDEAKRMISQVDKAREAYHRRYSGHSMSDKDYNHLLIDSSLLGIEGTCDILVDMIRKKYNRDI
jgi:cytidylate kinase